MKRIDERVAAAVRHFWETRDRQATSQGQASGARDAGLRTAVTGGRHLDAFAELCRSILIEAGLPEDGIFIRGKTELPGYFRAEKNWDLLAIHDEQIIAIIEFKAQVGPSFANNFNNRTEEALGNSTDLWAAYREGAFKPSLRPWLGYLFLLEDCERSNKPVKTRNPHFNTLPEFENASYADRYEIMMTKLLRERLYDGACLILSDRSKLKMAPFWCPSKELTFDAFAASLCGHVMGIIKSVE